MSDPKPLATPFGGQPYRPPRRYLIVSCDETGRFPGFWAEVAALTWEEAEALSKPQHFTAMIALIAPYIRAWNYHARDRETGAYRPLPPPAEAGSSALTVVDQGLVAWLRTMLMDAPLWENQFTPPATPPATTYNA